MNRIEKIKAQCKDKDLLRFQKSIKACAEDTPEHMWKNDHVGYSLAVLVKIRHQISQIPYLLSELAAKDAEIRLLTSELNETIEISEDRFRKFAKVIEERDTWKNAQLATEHLYAEDRNKWKSRVKNMEKAIKTIPDKNYVCVSCKHLQSSGCERKCDNRYSAYDFDQARFSDKPTPCQEGE